MIPWNQRIGFLKSTTCRTVFERSWIAARQIERWGLAAKRRADQKEHAKRRRKGWRK
jgi:hypothetical protein